MRPSLLRWRDVLTLRAQAASKWDRRAPRPRIDDAGNGPTTVAQTALPAYNDSPGELGSLRPGGTRLSPAATIWSHTEEESSHVLEET